MSSSRTYRVVVCRGPTCGDRRGSSALHSAFRAALEKRGLLDRVELGWQSCYGRCSQGPNVHVSLKPAPSKYRLTVAPMASGGHGALYNDVQLEDVDRIVDEHVIGGRIVRELILRPGEPAPRGQGAREGAQGSKS